jgi:hypothetical protein
LQWFDHGKRMDGTRTLRKIRELKLKGRLMGEHRKQWISQVLPKFKKKD